MALFMFERRSAVYSAYFIMDINQESANAEVIESTHIHRNNKSVTSDILEWLEAIAIAVMIVLLVFTFVLRQVIVEGSSMVPTLQSGDKLIISHLFYTPKQGDIVVVNCEGSNKLNKTLIKRVIATEGQEVNIDFETGTVTVDGKVLKEDYINALTTKNDMGFSYPVTVPKGSLFVMGDNRNHSTDSRNSEVGFLNVDDVLGKAIFRILPISKFGFVE